MSVEVNTIITSFSRNTNLDYTPHGSSSNPTPFDNTAYGCCWWDDRWRIGRDTEPIEAFTDDFTHVPEEDIALPDTIASIRGLTTANGNLIILAVGNTDDYDAAERLRIVTMDIEGTVRSNVSITIPEFTASNAATTPSSIAYDEDNGVVWTAWGASSTSGTMSLASYDPSTGGAATEFFSAAFSNSGRPEGMVWFRGYLIVVDRAWQRINAIDLSNRTDSNRVTLSPGTTANAGAMGIRGTDLYLVRYFSPNIYGYSIQFTTHTSITSSDNITAVTDAIDRDIEKTISLTDIIPAPTDAISTPIANDATLTDTIPAVTDTLSKSRGYLRTVDDSIAESLGEPILLGSNTLSDIRGMTFWEDENLIISSFFLGSTSNIILIQYNPTTHEFTITSTSAQLVSNRISGLAFIQSESKLLAATTNDISHMNAVPNNTTGATISGLDALTVTGIETPIQSLTYHPASGRVLIGVAGNTRKIFDFLYNASDGTLTDKRELTGNYTAGNPRSIALHGDVLVISDTSTTPDEINAYDYDPVAATLNNGRKLRDEPSINASTFAGDQYVLIRPDGGIYRHQYVAPFSGNIPVADTITTAFNKSISDIILALTDELTTAGDNTIPLSDIIPAPTDIVNANKDLTIPVSDIIPAPTDAINSDIEKTIPLSDIILTLTDAISSTGTNNIPLTDTIPAPTDSITPSRTYTRQITDAINGITDSIAKTKGFFRNLEDGGSSEETTEESISDPEDVATINADRIPIRGMAYHAATNNVYSAYKDGNEDQILSRTYTNRVLNATFVSRFVALTTFTPTSIAIAGNKLLIALNASTNPLDAIHDFTISATGALSAQRELRVEDIPRAVHGMAVHIPSGKVILTDPPDNRVWDYDYDPDAASDEDHLSNKRGILDEDVRLNPRTITFHGDIAIIGDIQSGKVHRYTYDPVAGTLTEEADLFTEAGVSASTMVDNDYLYGVSGGSEIRRRVFTPAGTATLSLSFTDTITKVTSYTRAVTDGITALADEIGTIIGKRFALSDSVADATDEVTRVTEQNRDITDGIAAPTDMIDAQGADDISVSDGITAPTDSIEKDSEIHIPISDGVAAITDNITKADGAGRTLTDTITAPTDSITPSRTYTRQITDAINGITDSITRAGTTYTRSITDTIHGITDTITETRRYTRSITDTIHGITDMVGLSSSAGISLTDTITAPTDDVTANKSYGRTVTDTISSVTDDITKRISKTITDTIRRVTDRIRITRPLVHGTPTRTYKLGYPLKRIYRTGISLHRTYVIPISQKPKRIYVNTRKC